MINFNRYLTNFTFVIIDKFFNYRGSTTLALSSRYLAFVSHAFRQDSRRFRNFMAYSRNWVEEYGSEVERAKQPGYVPQSFPDLDYDEPAADAAQP